MVTQEQPSVISSNDTRTISIDLEESREVKKQKKKSKLSHQCDLPRSICDPESRRQQRIPVTFFDGTKELKVF